MDHVLHDCTDDTCRICRGGLALCNVCGGAEGSLLPTCPGYLLTESATTAVYRGEIKSVDDLKPNHRSTEYRQSDFSTHVAAKLGFSDPFNASPREVYNRVSKLVDENAMLRKAVAAMLSGFEEAQALTNSILQKEIGK